MLNRGFKCVYIKYKDGLGKGTDEFKLVTDIQYHNNYILIEYYDRPDKTRTRIITTDHIEGVIVDECNEFEAKREWVEMNNAICGHNFTQMKFWPFEGKNSEIHIYPLYGSQDGKRLIYTNVIGIERKWDFETSGNELHIRTIDFGSYGGFHNIENIIVVPEEDIKRFIIKRSDHEDLEIKVNGGTYRDE